MWIEELANHLRAQQIAGVKDNVFVYTMGDGIEGILLTSLNDGVPIDPDLPGQYKGSMQLVVRSKSPKTSLERVISAVALIDSNKKRVDGQDISLRLDTVYFKYLRPRHYPVVYPRSDGDYYEASVNFDVCFVAPF